MKTPRTRPQKVEAPEGFADGVGPELYFAESDASETDTVPPEPFYEGRELKYASA